jgi:hypothetical protein
VGAILGTPEKKDGGLPIVNSDQQLNCIYILPTKVHVIMDVCLTEAYS